MKIDFQKNGTKVECKVTIDVPYNPNGGVWTFDFEHSDNFYAGFACDAMGNQMRTAIEKMRRDAYEQGWKDAKSKKVEKQIWFRRFWDEEQKP